MDDTLFPTERERPRRKRIYPRSYGKPRHAIRVPATDVRQDRAKKTVSVAAPQTGEEKTNEIIELPNDVVAVKIDTRAYVFVDAQDIGSVVGYTWFVRALNSFNACYRGAQTYWEEQALTPIGREITLRHRMFLHDLLMDTPEQTRPAIHELVGPQWIVEHRDYNGLNCTRANMRLTTSPDGFVPIPKVNLPVGVWWNYRKHHWSVRCMPERTWYVELGGFKTFEEGAIAYFECLEGRKAMDRTQATYAWGRTIEYKGNHYSIDEWTALREAEREQERHR